MKNNILARLLCILLLLSAQEGYAQAFPNPFNNFFGTTGTAQGGTGATFLGPTVNNNNGVFNTNQTAVSPDTTYNGIAPTYKTSFMNGVPADWTFTRTGNAWSFNQAGVLVVSGSNVGRVDYNNLTHFKNGLYTEPAATDNALYNEDLTNAVWTKTNATVALNATNVLGAANGASTVTATANNATVTQALTLTSNTSKTSVFLKCVTCTGAISVTQDGGSTYTPFYPPFNTWQREIIGAQTLTNPTVGIKISNSGDVVQVDIFQQESGIFTATSPIPTGSTAVTRNVESLSLTNFSSLGFNPAGGSFVLEAQAEADGIGAQEGLVMFTNSGDSDYIRTLYNTDNQLHGQIQNPSNFFGTGFGGFPSGVFRHGMTYSNGNNFVSYTQGNANSTSNDPSSGLTTANVPAAGTISLLYLGSFHGTAANFQGYMRNFSYWNSPLTAAVENQQVSFPNVASNAAQPMNWNVAAVNKCQALQPDATDCQNAMVNRVVPAGCNGSLTISAGGTYTGCYASTSASVAPITITTASAVTLSNVTLAAPGGSLISYTGPGGPTLTVNNPTGFGTSNSTFPAVLALPSQATLTIYHGRFSNTGGIFVNGGAAAYVSIDHTIINNTNGTGAAHAIQLGNSSNSAVALTGGITNNAILNAPYLSTVNDVINIYNGAGTATALFPITGNWIAGLYSATPLTTGNSGCGIIADNLSQYLNISYNTVIDTGNGGICVDTPATHNNAANNTLFSSGVINNTGAVAAQNVGLYFNGDTTNTATGNLAYWMKATNIPINTAFQSTNDYYFPNCQWCYNQNYGLESTIPNPNYLPSAIALEQQFVMPPSSYY